MRRWLGLVGLGLYLLTSPASAQPEGDRATAVVVVDFSAVLRESAASRDIEAQIAEHRATYQAEFDTLEADLRRVETELTQARATLPADQFEQRRREFERQIIDAQRRAQVGRAALDEANDSAMREVRDTLYQVIAEIAKERQADVVLNKADVVIVDPQFDISEEAQTRLDARLSRVEVTVEGQP
jgi:outer membrane protein